MGAKAAYKKKICWINCVVMNDFHKKIIEKWKFEKDPGKEICHINCVGISCYIDKLVRNEI